MGMQKPADAFPFVFRLLGKPFGCKLQERMKEQGYPFQFVPTNRSTIGHYFHLVLSVELLTFSVVALVHGEKTYSVEELIGMEMRNMRTNAKLLGIDVANAVVTVPVFYRFTLTCHCTIWLLIAYCVAKQNVKQ